MSYFRQIANHQVSISNSSVATQTIQAGSSIDISNSTIAYTPHPLAKKVVYEGSFYLTTSYRMYCAINLLEYTGGSWSEVDSKDRKTFGKSLIEHQVIRHKLADMSAKIDAMDAYLNQVAQLMNDGEMPVAEISKIKFFCSECIESIASESMQILGGAGYLRGNAIERIYREVKVMAIGGGSKEIMKDLTVKQLGL